MAGRPRKTTTTDTNTEKVEVKEKLELKPRKRVNVDRSTEVVFINNINSRFIYSDPRTMTSYELQEKGDTDVITVDELMRMKNNHPRILKEYWILLTDVYSDDIILEDVITFLGLEEVYKQAYSFDELEHLLTKDSFEVFNKVWSSASDSLKRRILDNAVELYRNDKMSDIFKIQLIQDGLKDNQYFNKDFI